MSRQTYVRVLVLLVLSATAATAEEVQTTPVYNATQGDPMLATVTPEVVKSSSTGATREPTEVASTSESSETPVAPLAVAPKLATSITKEELNSGLKKSLLTNSGLLKSGLGEKCVNNSDCSSNNSVCGDRLCVCLTGFVPSKLKINACVKVPSGIGDSCEEEAQCERAVPDSECLSGQCQCPPNYVNSLQRCWPKQMLGGICNITLQCSDVENGNCAQGVCSCLDPYIPSPINKCLMPAGVDYAAPCVEDIQCSHSYGDEARCSHNECRCSSNYHFNGSKCIIDKKLGENCTQDEDCKVSENGESRQCLGTYCACATGYNSLPNEDICTRSSGEELAVSLTWILCIVVAKYYLA